MEYVWEGHKGGYEGFLQQAKDDFINRKIDVEGYRSRLLAACFEVRFLGIMVDIAIRERMRKEGELHELGEKDGEAIRQHAIAALNHAQQPKQVALQETKNSQDRIHRSGGEQHGSDKE